METNTLLILIISLLTLNLLMVGVYIVLVLKEVRETVKKTNKILDDVEEMTDAVSEPVVDVAGVVNGVTSGLKAFKAIKNFGRAFETREEESELVED